MDMKDTQKLSGHGHGRYSETQWPWTWKILRNSVAMDMKITLNSVIYMIIMIRDRFNFQEVFSDEGLIIVTYIIF
jgi:hypothetical protein